MTIEIRHNYEWYKTGLVSVIHGSKKVTGTNTDWLIAGIKEGDALIAGEKIYEIEKVSGSETISLVKAYTGDSTASLEYAIIPRAKAILLADLAIGIQDAVAYWNERDNNLGSRITSLENNAQAMQALLDDLKEQISGGGDTSSGILGKMGFYIDNDGDLAQDEEHVVDPDNPNPSPENPEEGVATEDEVNEMIDHIFGE